MDNTPPASPTIPHKLKRSKDIALLFLKHGGREFVDRWGLGHFLPSGEDKTLPEKATQLREDLVAMGPTFIKLGQLMSTRADLFPPEILAELSLLQDQVEPLSFAEVKNIIEAELGVRLETLFQEFDPVPLGSASLGQVHFAVLRSGRRVGVKVQRPNIDALIREDMAVLRDFAHWFDQKTAVGKRYRFTDLQIEFERTLLQELNYQTEAQNLIRLKNNLAAYDTIVVPEPIPDYTTTRILTMDYVSGRNMGALTPLSRIELNGEKIADTLLSAYLKQVFVDGFFHADPHPGNVFVMDDNVHIALIDLGMVGTLSPVLRRRLLQLLPVIYRQDPDGVAEIVLEISETEPNVDRLALIHSYNALLQKTQANSLQQLGVSTSLFGIARLSAEAGVHLPPEISVLGRTLMHLDRIGRILSPNFDPNRAVERHIDLILQQHMLKDLSPRTLFKGLLEAKDFVERLPMRANRLFDALLDRKLGFQMRVSPDVHLLENLEKIANRITVGLILAALIVGASQLMQVQTRFVLFGYPGFAMMCFLLALAGAIMLLYKILKTDHSSKDAPPE
jgi:predicted unusual protein kinase regulating ubiquinone biosynthesis (AarF/ABC1/UbiB family)